ncbi:hypothetical protein [Streptomyces litchfieldiae]|uniref:Uncharacterized protein n=1 Tax=Streptomyces litchfieldiae TaxID=3075543 RepID=A0ABU2MIN0_9ACTN|nr:hypothetical protein [Streptomyces sp. DSM 44938]MDT0341452.1 hypothetical protein [Streptomyces sp. DSM 44938]
MALSDFPADLVRDQHAWNRTYQALATAGPLNHTALRRRLIRLSCRIMIHPFWGDGRRSATLGELRRRARDHEQPEGTNR